MIEEPLEYKDELTSNEGIIDRYKENQIPVLDVEVR